MNEQERATHTPFTVLYSAAATGLIPFQRMQQLDPSGKTYYFQRDAGMCCLTRYRPRPDPDTDAQRAQRQKFKDAWTAWQALSPGEKEAWRQDPLAKMKNYRGIDAFFSKYLKGMI